MNSSAVTDSSFSPQKSRAISRARRIGGGRSRGGGEGELRTEPRAGVRGFRDLEEDGIDRRDFSGSAQGGDGQGSDRRGWEAGAPGDSRSGSSAPENGEPEGDGR